MIIGIDGNEANIKDKVGVNQYAWEILWGLYKLSLANHSVGKLSLATPRRGKQNLSALSRDKLQDDENKNITYFIYLKNAPNSDLPKEKAFWKYKIIPGERLWVLIKLMPRLLFKEKVDVFFTPGHYLPLFSRSDKVLTIHDLGYLEFSGQFKRYDFWQLKYWSAISIIISKYIICPSETTAKDIVRRYPFAAQKVKVINHGYDRTKFNLKVHSNFVRQIRKKYRIPENYILFLSTLKPSKNIEGLLSAFSIITNRFPNLNLVIAGKKGWLYENIIKKVADQKLESKVIFTDYISEKEKPALIKGARCFVLPSFWEGFGMDVLEAMACGVPVVVSKTASLPEIVKDAGTYVDPYNIESIAEGLNKVLSLNGVEYNKMVKKGLMQAQKFSWAKSTRETLEIFEKAVR